MKRKTLLFIAMCMAAMLSLQPLSVRASDGEISCPQEGAKIPGQGGGAKYTDLQSYSVNTSAVGQTVYAELGIYTKNGATKTSGTMYLERLDGSTWKIAATWPVSGQGSFSVQKMYTGTSGRRYRTKISIQVGSDNINATSNDVTVN